jgi:hypothetical protein
MARVPTSRYPFPLYVSIAALLLSSALATSSAVAASRAAQPPQNRPPAGPPPDASYLAGMPSVDTVKRLIQGSDPTDTLARQVAIFNSLLTLIRRMGLAPGRRSGDTTAQEYAQINTYTAAATQITSDFGKNHKPDEVSAFMSSENKYEDDASLRTEMFQKLFTNAFLGPYAKVDQADKAAYQAYLNQQHAQNAPSQNPPPAPVASNSPSRLTKDETRCLEFGGSKSDCIGANDALLSGLAGVFGGSTNLPAQPHGLLINGDYKAADGMELNFTAGRVVNGARTYGMDATLSGCGNLISQTLGYSTTPRGNGYILQLSIGPKPIALTLGPGGQLVGTGATQVAGQVITGYKIVSQSRRYGDGTIVPGSVSSEKVPVYGPATASCSFGTFVVVPQTYTKVETQATAGFGVSNLAGKAIPTGVLMSGVYSAAGAAGAPGLRIEFSVDAVVMDCGEAHVKKSYTLQNSSGGIMIAIANDKPFTLALQPNGSLAGSGAVTINGRLLSGTDASGNYSFKAISASCTVGTFAPN